MSDARLSVIVPGYNTPRAWWERCLISVLRCCQQEDKVICVDDGSWRAANLDSFAREDERVKVLFRKNGGLSVARNTGMKIARGKFLAFVDSDDELIEGILYRCISRLEECGGDVAVYGVKTVWTNVGLQKIDVIDSRWDGILSPLDVRRLEKSCLLNYAWNKVYRRSFLASHSLRFEPKGMPCEDIIFNLEVIIAGSKWCLMPVVGYIYYRSGETLLSSYKKTIREGLEEEAKVWKLYCDSDPRTLTYFSHRCEVSNARLLSSEWDNIWRPHSPYSLLERWKWLKANPEIGGCITYIKMALFVVCRRYFYVRSIRRWHIKHLYPQVKEV